MGWACCDFGGCEEMCHHFDFFGDFNGLGTAMFSHEFISGYRSEDFASFLKLVVGPQLRPSIR